MYLSNFYCLSVSHMNLLMAMALFTKSVKNSHQGNAVLAAHLTVKGILPVVCTLLSYKMESLSHKSECAVWVVKHLMGFQCYSS